MSRASRRPTPLRPRTHAEVFRAAARRVLIVGLALSAIALACAAVVGGGAWRGAVWGAGTGALLTLITAASLAVDWDRFPLLASGGVMLSFAGKIAVMVVLIVLAGPHRSTMSPIWFLAPLAVILLAVAGTEIVALASGRALTVQPRRGERRDDGADGSSVP